jgi:hypothetical protein
MINQSRNLFRRLAFAAALLGGAAALSVTPAVAKAECKVVPHCSVCHCVDGKELVCDCTNCRFECAEAE